MTIEQWCLKRNRSDTSYYNLRKAGLAPEVIDPPCKDGGGPRITQQSDRNWEKEMVRLAKQESARKEAERKSAQASMAGKIAVKSLLHVSNRKRQSPQAAE